MFWVKDFLMDDLRKSLTVTKLYTKPFRVNTTLYAYLLMAPINLRVKHLCLFFMPYSSIPNRNTPITCCLPSCEMKCAVGWMNR